MSTYMELRVTQKQKLYMLLAIESDITELKRLKKQLLAEMDDEDIALVQKTLKERAAFLCRQLRTLARKECFGGCSAYKENAKN